MRKTQIAATIALLVLAARIPEAAEARRASYLIAVQPAQQGGPVRSVAAYGASLPEQILVQSDVTLDAAKQARFAWHFRNAARLAAAFAQKEGISIQRDTLPAKVEVFKNTDGVAEATGLPKNERLGTVVARMDLRRGIVYLGRTTPEDLYVELGKWLYYAPGYRWGQDAAADRKQLDRAERFAAFCLDAKNWTESGGSKDGLR